VGLTIIPKKYKVVYGDMNSKSEKAFEFFTDEILAIARFEELRKQYLYVYQSEIEEKVKRTTIR